MATEPVVCPACDEKIEGGPCLCHRKGAGGAFAAWLAGCADLTRADVTLARAAFFCAWEAARAAGGEDAGDRWGCPRCAGRMVCRECGW